MRKRLMKEIVLNGQVLFAKKSGTSYRQRWLKACSILRGRSLQLIYTSLGGMARAPTSSRERSTRVELCPFEGFYSLRLCCISQLASGYTLSYLTEVMIVNVLVDSVYLRPVDGLVEDLG